MLIRTPVQGNLWRERQRIPMEQNRYDKNLVVNREALCQRSTSTRWCGEYLSKQLCRPRYILDKIIKKIYVPPGTRTSTRLMIWYFTDIDQGSTWRNRWNIYDWLEYDSMGEKYFVERRSCRVVDSKGFRFHWFGSLCWRNSWISTISRRLEGEDWVVHEVSWISWIGLYWRVTSRVWGRFSLEHNTSAVSGNPNDDGGEQNLAWTGRRSNYHHVDVQRDRLGTKRKNRKTCMRHLKMLLHTPQDYWMDIGHSSEHDLKKMLPNATVTDQTVRGTMWLIWWWLISERADTLNSEEQVRFPRSSLTAELLLRIIISVNQLSIYGAVADWREEFAQQIAAHSFFRTVRLSIPTSCQS